MVKKLVVLCVFMIAAFAAVIANPFNASADDAVINGTVITMDDGSVGLETDQGKFKVEGVDLSGEVGKAVSVTGSIADTDSGQVIKATDFTVSEEGAKKEG